MFGGAKTSYGLKHSSLLSQWPGVQRQAVYLPRRYLVDATWTHCGPAYVPYCVCSEIWVSTPIVSPPLNGRFSFSSKLTEMEVNIQQRFTESWLCATVLDAEGMTMAKKKDVPSWRWQGGGEQSSWEGVEGWFTWAQVVSQPWWALEWAWVTVCHGNLEQISPVWASFINVVV